MLGVAGPRYPLVLFGVGLLASFLVFAGRRLPIAATAFCYCGLCINAYFLGTALAQPSLTRYAWTMQGLMVALLALGLWLLPAALAREGARRKAAHGD